MKLDAISTRIRGWTAGRGRERTDELEQDLAHAKDEHEEEKELDDLIELMESRKNAKQKHGSAIVLEERECKTPTTTQSEKKARGTHPASVRSSGRDVVGGRMQVVDLLEDDGPGPPHLSRIED